MVTSVSTLLDAARGDLVLRILGTARHGQVVRVRSPKCTIGAGPRCTVRLRARGLFPLHCLILRGTEATIVRRWAPDTLLNGQTFTDAVLAPGDRLSIGRIQLEVLASEPAGLPPAVASRLSRAPLPTATLTQATLTQATLTQATLTQATVPSRGEAAPPAAALQARLGQLRQQGRQRVRRLVEQLRAVRQQLGESQEALTRLTQTEARGRSNLADREQQVETLTQQLQSRESELTAQIEQLRADLAKLDSQHQEWQRQHSQRNTEKTRHEERSRQHVAELEAQHKKLQAECETLRRKQAEWELASAESYTSHEEQAQELERQKGALLTERQALDQARQRWEAEQAEAQRRSEQQRAELTAQQAELQAAVEALEQQQRQWHTETEQQRLQGQAEQEQWQKQQQEEEAALAERRQALDRQAEEVEAQREALEQERQRWEEEQAEARQRRERTAATAEADASEASEAEEPPQRVALDSLDLFRRLGTVPDWADQPEASASEPSAPERAMPEPSALSPPPVSRAASPTGEHEDESVDAYMARLLQRMRGEASSPAPEAAPERPPVAVAAPSPAAPVSPSPASAHIKPATPVSLAPRAVAPEKSVDLTAMRQLANFSAQVALGQHAHGQMSRERRMKLAVVGVSLVVGALLFATWWFRSAPMITLHAANLSFLIALIWGVQYAVLTGHMIVNRAGHLKWVSEPAAAKAVVPQAVPEAEQPGLPAINDMLAQYHAQGADTDE